MATTVETAGKLSTLFFAHSAIPSLLSTGVSFLFICSTFPFTDTARTSYDYAPEEPIYDEDEPPLSPTNFDADSPSRLTSSAQTPAAATLDPDTQHHSLSNGVVEVNAGGGDPSQAAGAIKRAGAPGSRDKKVPESERTTTPYMTKYERARVLGTRALQIRYVEFIYFDLLPEYVAFF